MRFGAISLRSSNIFPPNDGLDVGEASDITSWAREVLHKSLTDWIGD